MPVRNITGARFGMLVALNPTTARKYGSIVWRCICDCGSESNVPRTRLISGHTKSCGCTWSRNRIDANTTHGMTNTRLHRIWRSMKTRCSNPNSKSYLYYGGKGVSVCHEWMNSFEAFYDWAIHNGYKDNLSLDRINGDGNYEPGNCRWATMHEQRVNQRRS